MDEGGLAPPELVEGRLAERFGWTFSQLDEEDEGRSIRTVSLMNMADAYRLVNHAILTHAISSLSPEHWEIWKLIRDAGREEVTE